MTDSEASAVDAADADRSDVEIRIVSKNASDHDVAAVTAVLRGALAEHAAGLELTSGEQVSAWARSQRPIRRSITPGHDGWRGFSG